MSARLARLAFGSAARRAQTVASASSRVARRAMSSTSHGAHKSSDKPWIIGSTIVFLPAFLYLVSPSARKQEHFVHDDKHDFPGLKHKEEHAPAPAQEPAPEPETTPEPEKAEAPVELMKDDEGTVADVGASIAAAEADDVPKAAKEPEQQAAIIDEAKSAPVKEQSPEQKKPEASSDGARPKEQSSVQNKASSEDAPAKQQG